MSYNKISIEGNIGSGKSTVISKLCQDIRIPVFLEPVEEWKEWLTMFYSNPERWGMSFNLNVLLTFNKWKNNAFNSVYERSPLSNRYIFAELQFDSGRMNNLEMKMFEQIFNNLAWTPDIVIYIRTDPEVSMKRMQERGRTCEDNVPLDYIKSVHNKYEELFKCANVDKTENTVKFLDSKYMMNKNNCIVYIINGNRGSEEVYRDVLSCVLQHTAI